MEFPYQVFVASYIICFILAIVLLIKDDNTSTIMQAVSFVCIVGVGGPGLPYAVALALYVALFLAPFYGLAKLIKWLKLKHKTK